MLLLHTTHKSGTQTSGVLVFEQNYIVCEQAVLNKTKHSISDIGTVWIQTLSSVALSALIVLKYFYQAWYNMAITLALQSLCLHVSILNV